MRKHPYLQPVPYHHRPRRPYRAPRWLTDWAIAVVWAVSLYAGAYLLAIVLVRLG